MKTVPNDAGVAAFLQGIENEQRRSDCFTVLELMQSITGEPACMWGTSMVGFGHYHYKYDSGREGDWFLTGFSPRKQNLTIYIMAGFNGYDALMEKLGKYKTGVSCLYVKKLQDIHLDVLRKLVRDSVEYMRERYK